MTMRKSAAITGLAEMPSTKQPAGLTAMAISAHLAVQAVADAGLEKTDIDGLLTVTPIAEPSILWPTALCETLKLDLSYFDSVDLGGASSAGMIWRAAAAIHSGLCKHVLCVASDVMCGDSFRNIVDMAPTSDHEFELPYGNAPLSLQAIKRAAILTSGLELDEAFAMEDREASAIVLTEDAREGPRAFAEKRQPDFQGR